MQKTKHLPGFLSFIFIVFWLFPNGLYAQNSSDTQAEAAADTTYWKFSGFFSQQLNQAGFSQWAAGGESHFASTSVVNLGAVFNRDNLEWDNKLEMQYGIIKPEEGSMRKNADRIDFLSKFGRRVSPKLKTSALLNFQTQFDKGFKFPNDSVVVSRFMAPGYLTASLGMDYRPVSYLSIFFSPATGKFTFVRDQELADQGAFGVSPGENLNAEFGAMARIGFEKELFENVRVNSRLILFNNYTDSDKSNRKNTDVDWQTTLNMKVNRFITASFMLHMIYDHDIPLPRFEDGIEVGKGPGLQVAHMIGVGLSYSF